MVVFTLSVFERKYPFYGTFDYFEYVEFDGVFHFVFLDWKYPLRVNLVQKFKIVNLS